MALKTQLQLEIIMQRVYPKDPNLKNRNVLIINTVKFLINAFKRYTYRIDSVLFQEGVYLVTFFYVARRQPFTKPVTDIYNDKHLLKTFKPSEVALISYLYTKTKFNNMAITK